MASSNQRGPYAPAKGDFCYRRALRLGDAVALTIPREFCRKLGIFRGDHVAIRMVGRTLVLRKFLPEELLPLDACEARAAKEEKERLDREQ